MLSDKDGANADTVSGYRSALIEQVYRSMMELDTETREKLLAPYIAKYSRD